MTLYFDRRGFGLDWRCGHGLHCGGFAEEPLQVTRASAMIVRIIVVMIVKVG